MSRSWSLYGDATEREMEQQAEKMLRWSALVAHWRNVLNVAKTSPVVYSKEYLDSLRENLAEYEAYEALKKL